jgi:hypothetical protein
VTAWYWLLIANDAESPISVEKVGERLKILWPLPYRITRRLLMRSDALGQRYCASARIQRWRRQSPRWQRMCASAVLLSNVRISRACAYLM